MVWLNNFFDERQMSKTIGRKGMCQRPEKRNNFGDVQPADTSCDQGKKNDVHMVHAESDWESVRSCLCIKICAPILYKHMLNVIFILRRFRGGGGQLKKTPCMICKANDAAYYRLYHKEIKRRSRAFCPQSYFRGTS